MVLDKCDFIILTILEEELTSVLRVLTLYDDNIVLHQHPTMYYEINVKSKQHFPKSILRGLVVSTDGLGRVEGALKAQQVLSFCTPKIFFLVGLAGGINKNGVELGDILVANSIIDYERQKIKIDHIEMRWQTYELLHDTSKIVSSLGNSWVDLMQFEHRKRKIPRVHLGPILSGEKVIASSDFVDSFLTSWPSTIGVEMEGAGVAMFLEKYFGLHRFFMIRGVSDLANNCKSEDSSTWGAFACDASASYTVSLLLYLASSGYFIQSHT